MNVSFYCKNKAPRSISKQLLVLYQAGTVCNSSQQCADEGTLWDFLGRMSIYSLVFCYSNCSEFNFSIAPACLACKDLILDGVAERTVT